MRRSHAAASLLSALAVALAGVVLGVVLTSCAVEISTSETQQATTSCSPTTRGYVSCGTPNSAVSNTLCFFTCGNDTHCGDCQWVGFAWFDENSTTFTCPQLGPPPAGTGTHRAYCQGNSL